MWLALLWSCTGSPADSGVVDACAEAMVVVPGTDIGGFTALHDGDPLTMVHGPQGGWHLLLSLRASPVGEVADIHLVVLDEPSGSVVSDQSLAVLMPRHGDCGGEYLGIYGYLDVSHLADGDRDTPPELLEGHVLTGTFQVSDELGMMGSAAFSVVAARDPIDVLDEGEQEP